MKKVYFIVFAALLTVGCNGKTEQAQQQADVQEVVEQGRQDKGIKVGNGGENPTVMQLLKAYSAVYPTAAADSIFAEAGDKEDYVENWYNGSSSVFVDCIDYCTAWYNHGDTGDERLDARTYQRDNGHTLFAVRIEQQNPEQKLFCRFYDYDPKTQTMTPEGEPYKGHEAQVEGLHAGLLLGRAVRPDGDSGRGIQGRAGGVPPFWLGRHEAQVPPYWRGQLWPRR